MSGRQAGPPAAVRWRFGDPLDPLMTLLARGGIVAIPTESSYGLGVRPDSAAGVAAIYRLKERERDKPLPVVIAGTEQLAGLGIDPDLPILRRLAAFWPGPLTVALPLRHAAASGAGPASLAAAAGGATLAVRIPEHPRLRELLSALGHGLTATSANRSGEAPLLDPAAVAHLLAGGAGTPATPATPGMVVDDGILPGGLPSTLVAPWRGQAGEEDEGAVEVLRVGRLPIERLRERVRVVAA